MRKTEEIDQKMDAYKKFEFKKYYIQYSVFLTIIISALFIIYYQTNDLDKSITELRSLQKEITSLRKAAGYCSDSAEFARISRALFEKQRKFEVKLRIYKDKFYHEGRKGEFDSLMQSLSF